jgi:hypothetical protein
VLEPEKQAKRPFYILDPDHPLVVVFVSATQLLALISICLNLYIVAFGFENTPSNLWTFIQLLEIVYGIELILHFFTTYKDPETFVTISNIK